MYNEDYLKESKLDYPDLDSGNKYYVNGGNVPAYMLVNPEVWKYPTLAECCMSHFQNDFRDCIGDSFNGDNGHALVKCTDEMLAFSGKWYVQDYI